MASTGQVLSYSSTVPTWSDPTVKTSIIFSTKDGTDVVLDAEVLLDIKTLLEVIIELPDGHPLAEIKRDILVKKAMRTLGHK